MKTYLVTGVSRGMGKAVAENLLKDGNFLYGVYNTDSESAKQLLNISDKASLHNLDLSEYSNIDQFVADIGNIGLDGIINCAGVFEEVDFAQFDTKAFEKNFKVNAFAPVYLVSKLATKLNTGASIVNISSTDATTGAYTGLGYSASKAAISNLTLSMANLLANRKIRVNALAPGWIGDGMQSPEELLKIAAAYNPLGRVGTYDEIANIVQFLLSDKSTYINGAILNVDGGDSAKSYVLEQESSLRSED